MPGLGTDESWWLVVPLLPQGKSKQFSLLYIYHKVFCHQANATYATIVGTVAVTGSFLLILLSSYIIIKFNQDLFNDLLLGRVG
jgi:hypothetical protein